MGELSILFNTFNLIEILPIIENIEKYMNQSIFLNKETGKVLRTDFNRKIILYIIKDICYYKRRQIINGDMDIELICIYILHNRYKNIFNKKHIVNNGLSNLIDVCTVINID
jgi:hypothetical protein